MAKDLYDYSAFLRPNFEAWACGVWAASAGVALCGQQLTGLPPTPFTVMAACSGAMAFMRGRKALDNRRVQRRLNGTKIEFASHEIMKRWIEKHPTELYLGQGFEWHNRHIQKVQEILTQDVRPYLPKHATETGGAQWLHGLEPHQSKIGMGLASLKGHTLVLGTTRAGKSVFFRLLISQCCGRREPVIIIDPKGDPGMLAETRRACEFFGVEFHYVHPAFPERSVRINLLKNFMRGTDLAGRIASVVPTESGADPFVAFGHMALNNVVQGLLLIHSRPTLVRLRQQLERGPESLVSDAIGAWADSVTPGWESDAASYLKSANTPPKRAKAMIRFYREIMVPDQQNIDLDGLISMYEHDREHFQKMIASLLPVMAMLTSSELGPLFSPSGDDPDDERPIVDLQQIARDGSVLYIGLNSLSDAQVGGAIGALLNADIAAVAADRYAFGGDTPINLFVDEGAEAANVPFTQALNKGGGAGLRVTAAIQTVPDFTAKLGDESKAQQLLGNFNNVISFRVLDETTREYVTNNLPTTRYRYVMRTQGTGNASEPMMSTGNTGERLMDEEIELFPSQLLTMLPNLEYLARLADGRIIKGRIPILLDEEDR